MNIDFYRNYIEIVDKGTLSAAARELHVAQSALSNQLKQFEEEYKTQLLIRSSRQMELTDAGRILYKRAKDIIALVDASYKEIDACIEGSQGILRLGVTQAYPDNYVNNLLVGFQRENPEVKFEIREEDSREVLELLKAGVIEIGFTRINGHIPANFNEETSIVERMSIFCSRNNPWIKPEEETVAFERLGGMTLAISRGVEEQLTEMFERANISPEILSVSTSRSNTMMWAEAEAAVAIIRTNSTAQMEYHNTFCRPLVSDDPTLQEMLQTSRSIITLKNHILSAVGARFVNYMKEHIEIVR